MVELYVKKYVSKNQATCYFLVVEHMGYEHRHLLRTEDACRYLNMRPDELDALQLGNYKLYEKI